MNESFLRFLKNRYVVAVIGGCYLVSYLVGIDDLLCVWAIDLEWFFGVFVDTVISPCFCWNITEDSVGCITFPGLVSTNTGF